MSEYNYRLYFPVPQDDDRVGIAAMTVDKKATKDALPHSEKEAVIYCRGHGPHVPNAATGGTLPRLCEGQQPHRLENL